MPSITSTADTVELIVALKWDLARGSHDANIAKAADVARELGITPRHLYGSALFGFAGPVPQSALNTLVNDPRVALVDEDAKGWLASQVLPTGVDRIQADENDIAKIDGVDERVDVDIAILDTGVDPDHPDLNVVAFHNCADNVNDDRMGHGTHVAGIAGAIDNDRDVVGVAPGARLWAVKVILDLGGQVTVGQLLCGIDFVTNHASDIDVVNMSTGVNGYHSTLRSAIQNSVNHGVVYVVAAGNSGRDVYGLDGVFGTGDDYEPGSYPEVATVSAIGDSDGEPGGLGPTMPKACGNILDDTFACFTNYSASVVPGNPVYSQGKAIDLAGPGVDILSTYRYGQVTTLSGTSMASPHVAGTAALEIAAEGRDYNGDGSVNQLDVYAVRQALIDAAQPQAYWRSGGTGDPDNNPERLVYAIPATPPLEADIFGPTKVRPNEYCMWLSNVSGGVLPYSYTWWQSGYPRGTDPDVNLYTGTASFWVQLRVTDFVGTRKYTELFVRNTPSAMHCFYK